MSLLDSVLKKVKQQRNLKDASIKIFKRNIERLADNKEIKDFEFLKDTNKINEILTYYKPETQNSILQSVNRVLEVVDEPELLNTYRDMYYKVFKGIRKTPTDEKTDSQKENWTDWQSVEAKKYELINKAIDTQNWDDILNAFVLMLYTDFEPRRNQDYLDMYIVRRKLIPFKKYRHSLDKNKNYLMLNPSGSQWDYHTSELNTKPEPPTDGGYYFVFNKFKTAKTFGSQGFNVPNDIAVFFHKLYLNHYPAKKTGKELPLLVDKNGKRLSSVNAITRILNKIFDKKIGASMLRHIYLTHKYGETYKERELVSNKMGHTIGTQHKYIKKT